MLLQLLLATYTLRQSNLPPRPQLPTPQHLHSRLLQVLS